MYWIIAYKNIFFQVTSAFQSTSGRSYMQYLLKRMFSIPMGRELASEHHFEGVGFDFTCIMISNVNLGFYDREMFSNHMRTKLASQNVI